MECKHCGSTHVRRVPRTGVVQNSILPKFGYYPWECVNCRETFMLKARAKKRRSRTSAGNPPLAVQTPHTMPQQQQI